jgi:hypothetical protein
MCAAQTAALFFLKIKTFVFNIMDTKNARWFRDNIFADALF